MPAVANRTGESIIVYMPRVLVPACVGDHVSEVVTLTAQCVRSIHRQVGLGKQVGDQLARRRSLAEFVMPFEDVCPLGAMGTVRAGAAELAVIVGVMAIGTHDARSH